ncbi:MAG: hypothetical protein KJ077_08505 [Anaerolineae bacterium]|nr:hypothetical protein [Anaerolineae bacterium]
MSDIIESYCKQVADSVDENGVYPTPMVARTGKGIEFFAMMVEGPVIIAHAFKNCQRVEVLEQVVALDTYTQPGQGTELDSCLIIFHLRRGEPVRIGVLEYSWNNGKPVTKPVNWDNAFWNKQYSRLAADLGRAFPAVTLQE